MRGNPKDDPILNAEYKAKMEAVISTVDQFFNPPGKPKTIGLLLFVADLTGTTGEGRTNYMATVDRKSAIGMMKECLARWERKH